MRGVDAVPKGPVTQERIRELRARARHARYLALSQTDRDLIASLRNFASGLEVDAAKLEAQLKEMQPVAMEPHSAEPSTEDPDQSDQG